MPVWGLRSPATQIRGLELGTKTALAEIAGFRHHPAPCPGLHFLGSALICKGLPMSMPDNHPLTFRRQLLLGVLAALLVSQSGCGFMAHMMYWARGNPVDAKFPGL